MDNSVSIDLGHVARDLDLPIEKVERTSSLLDEGNTVPFITRYRKDQTGGLDEEQIQRVQETVARLRLLAERKSTILKSIETQGKLTEDLASKIRDANSTKHLEDLYLPFKPKKQTLATLARQRGLEPLAQELFECQVSVEQLAERATHFIRVDKDLPNLEEVMLGVGHLLAERFSEGAELRGRLRKILWRTGKLVTTAVTPPSAEKVEAASQSAGISDAPADIPPVASSATAESDAPTTTQSDLSQPSVDGEDQPTTSNEPPPADASSQQSAQPGPASAQPKPAAKRNTKKDKKKQKQENAFRDYYDFREPLTRVPPHRILAINRGERAKMLRVKIEVDSTAIDQAAENLLIPEDHPHIEFLRNCLHDALSRLVLPSLEREIRRELTERAERHAVDVFARNLRKLLLQPPVRDRRVLAVDPGFRSGCKIVALDQFGNALGHDVIHIIGSEEKRKQSRQLLVETIKQHGSTVIAIGNGTACRETEQVIADVLAVELKDSGVEYVIVNEAGASVYSASAIGREELPSYDATVRGAISIGRRLLDPLSELVKINAANIGVGMYQHDVKASHLRESLDAVVASCVNYVGVDVNSASPALLRYVSGLNQLTARRLYEYRGQHGPFANRERLKEVAGFGEATFVQSAGFLKITGGDNPLDSTWIHPESYDVARKVLEKLDSSVDELVQKQPAEKLADQNGAAPTGSGHGSTLADRVRKVESQKIAEELDVGKLLLDDILTSITRPGRDPREDLPPPIFRRGIMKLENLKPGMELIGTVLNVVDFGAFVDIGLSDSGLVHISRLADRFVGDPHEVVGVGDVLKVWVLEVDKVRRRVSLTAIEPGTERPPQPRRENTRTRPENRSTTNDRKEPTKSRQTSDTRSRKRVRPPKYQSKPKRKPKPVTPITDAMAKGNEPMRSFSDLKQFFERKDDDDQSNDQDQPSSPQ